MKKIVFLFLALLVLVVAGVGGYIIFFQKKGEQVEEAPTELQRPKGQPSFVELNPLLVPIISAKGAPQNLLLKISLEVYGDEARESVRQISPRLEDAFLRTLYGAGEQGRIVNGEMVNIDVIRSELKATADKVLGPGVVWDVLIQSVSQRYI